MKNYILCSIIIGILLLIFILNHINKTTTYRFAAIRSYEDKPYEYKVKINPEYKQPKYDESYSTCPFSATGSSIINFAKIESSSK